MALTLDLPPEVEARFREQAAQKGMAAEDMARKIIEAAFNTDQRMNEPDFWLTIGGAVTAIYLKQSPPPSLAELERELKRFVEAFYPRLAAEKPSSSQPGEATRALFAAWDDEDATDDPEEIAARNRDWEEIQAELEAHPFTLRESDL